MRTYVEGNQLGRWTLITRIGGGGNGEVWLAQNGTDHRAIKFLRRAGKKAYARFRDETTVLEKNKDVSGIIPIEEKYIPPVANHEVPYYVMPLAQASSDALSEAQIERVIDAVIEVARTLHELHTRSIYHRDIKPNNILYHNGRFCLADFGLVDFPDKEDVSDGEKKIGPRWTIAPEMERNPIGADLSRADVYSLAKTLWIYLCHDEQGFEGQYSATATIALSKYHPDSYTNPLDGLLHAATDNDPKQRPSMREFISALQKWKELAASFHLQNVHQWEELQKQLFPISIPERACWLERTQIIQVLNTIGSIRYSNHTMFPDSGGMDLEGAKESFEEGCIEVVFANDYPCIVHANALMFESFRDNPDWGYFRLELNPLNRMFPAPAVFEDSLKHDDGWKALSKGQVIGESERIAELSPLAYYEAHVMDDKHINDWDYVVTSQSRIIWRWLRGSFLIVCKRSEYNQMSLTYHAFHQQYNPDDFRALIQRAIDHRKKKKEAIEGIVHVGPLKRTVIDDQVKEHEIFRCGYCGNIITESGEVVEEPQRSLSIKAMQKFNIKWQTRAGECCLRPPAGKHP